MWTFTKKKIKSSNVSKEEMEKRVEETAEEITKLCNGKGLSVIWSIWHADDSDDGVFLWAWIAAFKNWSKFTMRWLIRGLKSVMASIEKDEDEDEDKSSARDRLEWLEGLLKSIAKDLDSNESWPSEKTKKLADELFD